MKKLYTMHEIVKKTYWILETSELYKIFGLRFSQFIWKVRCRDPRKQCTKKLADKKLLFEGDNRMLSEAYMTSSIWVLLPFCVPFHKQHIKNNFGIFIRNSIIVEWCNQNLSRFIVHFGLRLHFNNSVIFYEKYQGFQFDELEHIMHKSIIIFDTSADCVASNSFMCSANQWQSPALPSVVLKWISRKIKCEMWYTLSPCKYFSVK